jgi:hypothetical protein
MMTARDAEVGGAVSDATKEADRRDSNKHGKADRMPTPDEERTADELDLDEDVAKNYKEAIETGANVKGEGRID